MGNYLFEIAVLFLLAVNIGLFWFTSYGKSTMHNFAILANMLEQIQAKLENLEQQLQSIETEISTR